MHICSFIYRLFKNESTGYLIGGKTLYGCRQSLNSENRHCFMPGMFNTFEALRRDVFSVLNVLNNPLIVVFKNNSLLTL